MRFLELFLELFPELIRNPLCSPCSRHLFPVESFPELNLSSLRFRVARCSSMKLCIA